jgi:hypothetical protein
LSEAAKNINLLKNKEKKPAELTPWNQFYGSWNHFSGLWNQFRGSRLAGSVANLRRA